MATRKTVRKKSPGRMSIKPGKGLRQYMGAKERERRVIEQRRKEQNNPKPKPKKKDTKPPRRMRTRGKA